MQIKEEPDIEINNIVTSSEIDSNIDLQSLYDDLENNIFGSVEYDKSPPRGIRINSAKQGVCTISIYESGTYVVKGAKSKEDVDNTEKLAEDILGRITDISADTDIENIVAQDRIESDKKFLIEPIYENLDNVEYDPEQFPGLYWTPKQGISILFYANGKFIISGCDSIEQAQEVSRKFRKKLNSI